MVRYEEACRTLFERSPSLTELDWELWAGTLRRTTLGATRDTALGTSSTFGPKGVLERIICFCDQHREAVESFDWMDLLVDAPFLFHQQPDFVPAFTLDRFLSASSSS